MSSRSFETAHVDIDIAWSKREVSAGNAPIDRVEQPLANVAKGLGPNHYRSLAIVGEKVQMLEPETIRMPDSQVVIKHDETRITPGFCDDVEHGTGKGE